MTQDAVRQRGSRLPTIEWWAASLLMMVVVGLVWVIFQRHTPGESTLLPPCLFREITGLFCTGCGITRALHALAHANIPMAWAMNPLAILALPVAGFLWLDLGLHHPARWRWAAVVLRDARVWAVVILVFTIGRNLPLSPFSSWAPG